MSKHIFRYVTPVFGFAPVRFVHRGKHGGDVQFSIEFRPLEQGEPAFEELVKYASETAKQKLVSLHISERSFEAATTVLLVDVFQEIEAAEPQTNSKESLHVHSSIVSALQLHCTKGVTAGKTYQFSEPAPAVGAYIVNSPLVSPYTFSHLGSRHSELPSGEHGPCRETFDRLRFRRWDVNSTLDTVLQLAIAYFQASFTFADVAHAFLISMVALEALFKDEDENIGKLAKRISRLLATSRANQKSIHKEFHSGDPNTFGDLRNQIAHGSPSLDVSVVAAKYPDLFGFLQKAITEMLGVNGPIRNSSNYYQDLEVYLEKRFSALP